ncbi:type II toxin-antitoxin system Phd/YefM family antitoxin [Leptolyngbya sp. 15MV]|nr:type II toxin-antitoxin system Phd/YefM family antitoxin [Leptolyngbya sp. 15MV]
MRELQLRDAKAHFSAVVEAAEHGEAAVITRHGKPAAVVLGYEDWKRLANIPSFGRMLMESPLEEDDIPARGNRPLRDVDL